ncbi:MAG: GIY-YIG nuclease family protein [Patescibacteria group bacterium]
MHYVYILKSLKNNEVYVGFSSNLRTRLELHNLGRVKSTKAYKPWKLVYYEAYKAKEDATRRERELKQHAAKNGLLKHIRNSLA